ncbi:MAG: LptF/LptG family permease [Cyanobacteriota bacterium]|nr:LptF/LptG family permease [Cyanobacteriota bacterium]
MKPPSSALPPAFGWRYLSAIWGSLWLGGFFLEGYLLKEMIRPFFLGVAGGTTLLLGNQLFLYTDLLVKKGVPPITILQILVLNLPAILVVTFPIAGLFATLLMLGRMGSESEITALRAAGISYRRLFIPVLCIGMAISVLAFLTNDFIVPLTNQKVRTLNHNLFLTKDAVFLDAEEFFKVDDNLWFYIGRIDRETGLMEDVLILDRKAEIGSLRYPQVITARTARQEGQDWLLEGAVVRRYDDQARTYYEGKVGRMQLHIADDLVNLAKGDPVPQEQSARVLAERIQKSIEENRPSEDIKRLRTEWHLKFSIPFASFFAIMIAAPLGLQTVRQTGRYGGVAVAIVLVFIYYVLLSLSRSLGRVGSVDPWLAAWLPNIVFAGLGTLLLARFVK